MKTVLISYSPELFVSVDELKANLRISHDLEFSLIETLIKTAIEYVEQKSSLELQEKTKRFERPKLTGDDEITLEDRPIKEVQAITYLDDQEQIQEINLNDLDIEHNEETTIKPISVWPIMSSSDHALKITYVTGQNENIEPKLSLKQAVILLATHWYENRSAAGIPMKDIPHGVEPLINLHKRGWF